MSSKTQKIPGTLRNTIWGTYMGTANKTGKCFCCNIEDISTANFECGHIVSIKNGGELSIANLRPICSLCNKSMGARNMEGFMTEFGYKRCAAWDGLAVKAGNDETTKLKTKLKNKEKTSLDKLNFKELRYIATRLSINETLKGNIIDALLEKDFDYADWYTKVLTDTYSTAQLKTIFKHYKLKDKGVSSKNDIIKVLVRENKTVVDIIDTVIEIETKNCKYVVECNGDNTLTCVHCKKCPDGIIIQCNNCNNRHVYFTDTNLTMSEGVKIEYCKDYVRINGAPCSKCNTTTLSDIWNNPFHTFDNKNDKIKCKPDVASAPEPILIAKEVAYDTLPVAPILMPTPAGHTTPTPTIESCLNELKQDINEIKTLLFMIAKNQHMTNKHPSSVDDLLSL